ncbi:MAG: hypothetical protein ACFFG0_51085 [Candidatus Thorarchaeota archaeon]
MGAKFFSRKELIKGLNKFLKRESILKDKNDYYYTKVKEFEDRGLKLGEITIEYTIR